MKKYLILFLKQGLLLFTASMLMTGCNTVHGFGQDMQAGGQSIQKAANEDK